MTIATIVHETVCQSSIVALPKSCHLAGWIDVFLHAFVGITSTIVLDFVLSPTSVKFVDRIATTCKDHHYTVNNLVTANAIAANFFDPI